MTTPGTSAKLDFDPPGPGSWAQDPVHFPRPMTRYFQETHPPAYNKGTNDFARDRLSHRERKEKSIEYSRPELLPCRTRFWCAGAVR